MDATSGYFEGQIWDCLERGQAATVRVYIRWRSVLELKLGSVKDGFLGRNTGKMG